ncbi:glycosyltransferase [Massilia sp. UYP32]|uniref:glycosyltransferase n=1 Tax=Massilia sp. UYP32 TaxID=1756386 RepID=UPI003D1C1EBC
MTSTQKIEIAIILPVFKHSVLVAEAIESGLQQITNFDYRIVIINDGCPYVETDLVCSSYAITRPEKIVYIKKPNGGLSSARNAGIDYAVNTWKSLKGVYFLDADNRLHPKAMQHGYDALAARGFTGWVYPDIDMFGYPWYGDFSGEYCKLTHLGRNICEAGSMVSQQLLAKGVRFDENMKLGFEDWDFWLSALEAGESGSHCPSFGFMYRKRAESMLADSNRDSEEILSYMRRKHSRLYKKKSVLQTENDELPRYSIILEDTNKVVFATDPRHPNREISIDEFEDMWWATTMAPARNKLPSFVVTSSQRTLDLLERNGLLHWTLWRLEDAVTRGTPIALATVAKTLNAKTIGISSSSQHYSGGQRYADIAMISSRILHSAVVDTSAKWLSSLSTMTPEMQVFDLALQLEIPQDHRQYRGAVSGLLRRYTQLRESSSSKGNQNRWLWKDAGIPSQFDGFTRAREACQISATLYPRVSDGEQRDVAFLVPLLKFGGVEKVALNVAREMASNGWRITFVIMDDSHAVINKKEYGFVDSIIFLDSGTCTNWDGQSYYGTNNDSRAEKNDLSRLYGLLASMDLVINSHSAMASGAMGQLRRFGVKTANYLHVTDLTAYGRPVGHSYLGLAYEHAYDYFLTCSNQMADWLHGMGVPESKIIPIPNGPGYPIHPDALLALHERKQYFSISRDLRILFIGRFDGQKGLERALELAAHTKNCSLPVEWRFVGGNVLDKSSENIRNKEVLANCSAPPAYDASQISEHYLWADIIFMPSHWEGLPLTAIEAMRLGCVPLTTEVGAINELIEHTISGFTLKNYSLRSATQIIQDIIYGKIDLGTMANNAIATAISRNWEVANSFQPVS